MSRPSSFRHATTTAIAAAALLAPSPTAAQSAPVAFTNATVLTMDGARVASDREKTEIGEVRAYRVPKEAVKDRKLVVTWKAPEGEGHLGWRQRSRVAEIWLVKK